MSKKKLVKDEMVMQVTLNCVVTALAKENNFKVRLI